MPVSASAVFVSSLPHRQNLSLWGLFALGETKSSHSGWDWVNRKGGAWRSYSFWSKTAEHSAWCGQCAHKSPIMKWAKCWKRVFQKNFTEAERSLYNNASWYTDTEGFLEHPPSGGSLYYKRPALQKIILGFLGSPLILWSFQPNIEVHVIDLRFKNPSLEQETSCLKYLSLNISYATFELF